MAATLPDRKPIREYIAAGLTTALTAAAVVYDHQPGAATIAGQSPVVAVRSGGTAQRMASYGVNPSEVIILVSVYVKHSDPAGGYDAAGAEDLIDNLEQDVRQWVRDNAGPTISGSVKLWDNLDYGEGPSTSDYVNIVGVWYRREIITIRARIHALSGS